MVYVYLYNNKLLKHLSVSIDFSLLCKIFSLFHIATCLFCWRHIYKNVLSMLHYLYHIVYYRQRNYMSSECLVVGTTNILGKSILFVRVHRTQALQPEIISWQFEFMNGYYIKIPTRLFTKCIVMTSAAYLIGKGWYTYVLEIFIHFSE